MTATIRGIGSLRVHKPAWLFDADAFVPVAGYFGHLRRWLDLSLWTP